MPHSEEWEDASAFVSYPPTPHSEKTTSTEPQPTDTSSETAEISVSNPSTVLNSASVPIRRNPPRNRKPPEKLTH